MRPKFLIFIVLVLWPSLLIAQADLSIGVTDVPDPAVLGTDVTYTIVATNGGPSNATNVVLTDTIPASAAFQALSAPDDWQCTTPEVGTTGAISCSKTAVLPGESISITIVVKPSAAGVLTNVANVAAAEPDTNPVNNYASAETTVVPAPDQPGIVFLFFRGRFI